jgi:hypothetical protein
MNTVGPSPVGTEAPWGLLQRASTRFVVVCGLVMLMGLVFSAIGGATVAGPEITGIAPDPVEPGATARTVTVSGNHFLERLTLTVTGPDGRAADYREPAITQLRETSFLVPVVFPVAGRYQFVVTNADGTVSNPFAASAKAQSAAPVISAVLPDRLQASGSPQALTVQGQRFVPGMSVTVTDPAGTVQDVPAGSIADVRPTSMQVTVTLQLGGDYSIVATSPSGTPSNGFGFRVGPR